MDSNTSSTQPKGDFLRVRLGSLQKEAPCTVEYPIYGVDIDQDASSGRDQGVSSVSETTSEVQVGYLANKILSAFTGYSDLFGTINWTVSTREQHVSTPIADYYVTLESKWSATAVDSKTGVLTIEDAKMVNQVSDVVEQFDDAMSSYKIGDFSGVFNTLAPTIGNGAIKAGLAIRDGMVGFKIAIEGSFDSTTSNSAVQSEYTLTLETYIHQGIIPQGDYEKVSVPVGDPDSVIVTDAVKVGAYILLGAAAVFGFSLLFATGVAVAPAVGELIALIASQLFGQIA